MKKYLLTVLFMLLCSPIWATTYCVSNTGSDAAAGTATGANCTGTVSAWQTLSKAGTATASSGDTVLLQRGGIWREQFTGSHSITYGDYGNGAKPSVRGSDTKNTAGNWTQEGALWYLSSITHDPGFVMHDDVNQCTGQACAGLIGQRKTAKVGLLAQWDSWWDSPNSRLYVWSTVNPTSLSSMLEVPVRSDANADLCHSTNYTNIDMRGFYDKILVTFGCAVITNLTNVDFGPTATYDIQYNRNTGTGMTGIITGSTFTDWGVVPGAEQFAIMAISGAGPIDATNNTATLNHSNTSGIGFVDQDINGWIRLVSGNFLQNNGVSPVTGYGIYQATTASNGLTITVTNNIAIGAGMCIDINGVDDGGATPSVEVSYNYCQDSGTGDVSDHHAIRYYANNSATAPALFKYNIVNRTVFGSNAHAGFGLDGGIGGKFYHNVVVGADDGFLLKNTSTGNDMRNNGSAFNRGFGINNSSGTVTTFTNNGFYSNTSGNYNSITAGTGDVLSNPFFANRFGNDLRVSKNSPWIDAGANLGATYQLGLNSHSTFPHTLLSQDLYGAGWDIGAYIFVPGDSWMSLIPTNGEIKSGY